MRSKLIYLYNLIMNKTDRKKILNNSVKISSKLKKIEKINEFNKLDEFDKSDKSNNSDKSNKYSQNSNYNNESSTSDNKLIYEKIENKTFFFSEMLKKQLDTVPLSKKFSYNDVKRISKFLSSSIFDNNKCCIWNGYITNETNSSKGTYINFYFKKKKNCFAQIIIYKLCR